MLFYTYTCFSLSMTLGNVHTNIKVQSEKQNKTKHLSCGGMGCLSAVSVVIRVEELSLIPTSCNIRESKPCITPGQPNRSNPLNQGVGEPPWNREHGTALQLTAQDQTQDYDLACPNIHSICDLLEHVKVPDLRAQSCTISTTLGANKKCRNSLSWGPALNM